MTLLSLLRSHDYMAQMMNVNMKPFREKFKDPVDHIKRSLLQYAKSLQEAAGEREVNRATAKNAPELQMKRTELGFSILQNSEAWKGRLMKNIELVLHANLGQHFRESCPSIDIWLS